MGNDIVNFNPAYNTWAKYRAAVKYAKQARQSQSNDPVIQYGRRNGSVERKNSKKENYQKQSKGHQAYIRPNSRNGNQQRQSVRMQQVKKKLPSIITGSKIAPLCEQIIKGNLDEAGLYDNSPLLKKTQNIGNNPVNYKNNQNGVETILVRNNSRNNSRDKTVRFASKIDMIDNTKMEVKRTRQRIDVLANGQERQYLWMLSQLQNERMSSSPDINKILFILKQSKQYQRLIVGLRTKRQVIVRILNELNEHKMDDNFHNILKQANKYIDTVQQQFIRIDWRAIIAETAFNMQRYVDIINAASTDKYVLRKLAQMQGQPIAPEADQFNQIMKQHSTSQNNSIPRQSISSKNQKLIDNRMSHQIMIDSIQRMIAGQADPVSNKDQNFGLVITSPSQLHTTPVYRPPLDNKNKAK